MVGPSASKAFLGGRRFAGHKGCCGFVWSSVDCLEILNRFLVENYVYLASVDRDFPQEFRVQKLAFDWKRLGQRLSPKDSCPFWGAAEPIR